MSWFTKKMKAVLISIVAVVGVVAGAVAGIASDNTVADKAAKQTQQIAPRLQDAIKNIPASDEKDGE